MSFRGYALAGFAAAITAGLGAAAIHGLDAEVVLLQALASAATFLTLAYRSARAGAPNLVWQRYILAAGVASVAASAAAGHDALASLDVFAVGAAAQLAFGRLGCRAVGCCHGRRHAHRDGRVPVQLVEAGASAAICGAGLIAAGGRAGGAAMLVIVAQSVVRFALEEYRGDGGRRSHWGLTEAQWVAWGSCLAIAAGLAGRPTAAALAATVAVSAFALTRAVTGARNALASALLAPAVRCRLAELVAADGPVAPTALAGGRALASASTVDGTRVVTISSGDGLRGPWVHALARPGRVVAQRRLGDGRVVHVVVAG